MPRNWASSLCCMVGHGEHVLPRRNVVCGAVTAQRAVGHGDHPVLAPVRVGELVFQCRQGVVWCHGEHELHRAQRG